jgi:hypothetical protein
MSTFATSKSDWLNEAGSGFLEFYFPYLESGKDKHPYNDVSALINRKRSLDRTYRGVVLGR